MKEFVGCPALIVHAERSAEVAFTGARVKGRTIVSNAAILHEGCTQVGFGDILVALAAGSAGTLAFTRGLAGAVIGVMVAVALMPPLVVCGMLLGAGHFAPALGAFFLLAVNLVCVNLAGVGIFLLQGVRRRSWWAAERAKKATWKAVVVWAVLLAVLILM